MLIEINGPDDWECYNDRELWKAFSADSRSAFSALFLRFYERLYRYGRHFSSSEEAVKDGIQKLFFRLWKKRKKLPCPQSIEGYLYVSLRRIMLRSSESKMARNKRNTRFTELEPDYVYSIEEQLIKKEEKKLREQMLQRALPLLTSRQREALLLRIDSGMSNQEIGTVMELSEKRVRNLIYEATKRLREEIGRLTRDQQRAINN